MKVYTLVLLCASSLVSANALAQWQWLDAQGRKVFSDLPPPNQVPPERILQRPSNTRPAAIPAPSGPAPAGSATMPAPPPEGRGVDRELQARKAAEEAEQARREQALAQQQQRLQEQQQRLQEQQRQDNCARARVTLATLADGRLVAHTNAQGERSYMDENARARERQRAQAIIASDCAPAGARAAARSIPPSALPSSLPPSGTAPAGASRRDPTPPELARPGAARPGRPDEPSPPTIQ